MADTKDELAARRWFRRRLAWLGRRYPELKEPAQQERLTEELDHQPEEDTTHATQTHREPERTP